MKSTKIAYWVSTGFIVLMMLFSAYSYLTSEEIKQGFIHLGFPGYFRVELAIAKITGVALLLIPAVKGNVKEWVYAGFAITFLSAFIAHFSVGDPAGRWLMTLLVFSVLLVSYFSYHRLHKISAEASVK